MRAYQMKVWLPPGTKGRHLLLGGIRHWMNEKGKGEVMARKRTNGYLYGPHVLLRLDIELQGQHHLSAYCFISGLPRYESHSSDMAQRL